jgi:hypothetical protein
MFGGGAGGAASERDRRNQFITAQNAAQNQRYGTQQNAALQALLARGNEATSRYGTRQGATTNALQGLQGATSRALEAQSAEGLERARLGLQAPSIAAKQSIFGSMMKNMQPHQFTSPARQQGHLTNVTGGLSAASLDPTTRQHGEELMKSALQAQLSGGGLPPKTDFMGGVQDWKSSVLDAPEATDYSKGLLNPPQLQGYQNAGKGESLMSMLGLGGGILGQLLPALGGGGGRTPITLSNQMPTPYTGMNATGVPSNFQLPRGELVNDPLLAEEFLG